MAKTKQDARLNTRSGRAALKQNSEPYWRNIAKGLAVGYRKGSTGGTWLARHFAVETGRRKGSLGVADDYMDADGVHVLSFDHAQAAAHAWHKRLMQADTGEVQSGSYTISNLMADYITNREREKGKSLKHTRSVIDTHISPALGIIEVNKLTHSRVERWRDALAEAEPKQRKEKIDQTDSGVRRQRRATANRIFTVLRAALNFGYKRHRIATKAAWEKITPFAGVDAPKVRYLSIDECQRLIAACPADFGLLVQGALYTGCRYGELIALQVNALNLDSNTLHIPESKSGKARNVVLTDEGAEVFANAANGRPGQAFMFTHDGGPQANEPWSASQQTYWMDKVCADAKITPAISFHILRHTYASHLAMNSAPMPVIAAQLGHADLRMTTKHYAHLGQSYVADVVRANLPSFALKGPQLVSKAS